MKTNARRTTGIGSLPHHNVDAALDHSFRMGIPFLPQIPIRNPWEFMLAQALEGIPGLQAQSDGTCLIAPDIWASRAQDLERRLQKAFIKSPSDAFAFSSFEPGTSVSSSWQAFVWELAESKIATPKEAKIQIAGPLTARWALRSKEGCDLGDLPGLDTQIFRLILARSLGMCRRLAQTGVRPILFLDEPGLYSLSLSNPRHVVALSELKLLIQALKKEGNRVGLHVCSNTDWGAVLGLGIDILSIDTSLSLAGLLAGENKKSAEKFLAAGGRLALGVIPTGETSQLRSLRSEDLVRELRERLDEAWHDEPERIRNLLETSLLTPACGLALHTPEDAEAALALLDEVHDRIGGGR